MGYEIQWECSETGRAYASEWWPPSAMPRRPPMSSTRARISCVRGRASRLSAAGGKNSRPRRQGRTRHHTLFPRRFFMSVSLRTSWTGAKMILLPWMVMTAADSGT